MHHGGLVVGGCKGIVPVPLVVCASGIDLQVQLQLQLLLSLLPLAACENHIKSEHLPLSCYSSPPEARTSAPREEEE